MLNDFRLSKKAKNSIVKRIQFLLTRNFYTIEDFSKLKNRKAIKVIKLIAKIENVFIKNNKEIKEIVSFIKNIKFIKKSITASVKKLFAFIAEYFDTNYKRCEYKIFFLIFFIFNFRIYFKKIFRI